MLHFNHIFAALVALPAEAMLRKPLFGLQKRRQTAEHIDWNDTEKPQGGTALALPHPAGSKNFSVR
jgi:hypothetical protein